jgi:molybdate transport repressor ModE-like protein
MVLPTFRRLKVFVAVAESGSFAGAARQLGIAQPSVSAHIKSLEQEASSPLFERRNGREPVLTETGRSFLLHARTLLASASHLEKGLTGGGAEQSLSIACQRSLANAVLQDVLAGFARRNRDIRTAVRIGTQEEVVAAVRSGGAEIGLLMSNEPVDGLVSRLIGRLDCLIYATPDHPLAGRTRVSPAEVAPHDFVGPPTRSLFGMTIRRMLASVGVSPVRVSAEVTEFGTSRDFTVAGLGLGCSLRASVRDDLASGRVVAIDLAAPPLLVDVLQVVNPNRTELATMRQFAAHIDASVADWS